MKYPDSYVLENCWFGVATEHYLDDSATWGYPIQSDLFKLMQYTGLKDRYGKEIYEGDILDCQDRIVKVVWHEQAGQWDSVFIRYQFDLCSNGISNYDWKYRAVIIGNIYENPELP